MIYSFQILLCFSNYLFVSSHLLPEYRENPNSRSYEKCKMDCDYHRHRLHDSGHSQRFEFKCSEFRNLERINCLSSCEDCPRFICDPDRDPNVYHCPCKEYMWPPLGRSADSDKADCSGDPDRSDDDKELSVVHIAIIVTVAIAVLALIIGIGFYCASSYKKNHRLPVTGAYPNYAETPNMTPQIGSSTGTGMAASTSSSVGGVGEGGGAKGPSGTGQINYPPTQTQPGAGEGTVGNTGSNPGAM